MRKPRRRPPPDRRRQLGLRPDDLHDGVGPVGLHRHRGQADRRILCAGKAPRRHGKHGPRLRRCGLHEPRRVDPHGRETSLRGKDGAPLLRHPALEGARRQPQVRDGLHPPRGRRQRRISPLHGDETSTGRLFKLEGLRLRLGGSLRRPRLLAPRHGRLLHLRVHHAPQQQPPGRLQFSPGERIRRVSARRTRLRS